MSLFKKLDPRRVFKGKGFNPREIVQDELNKFKGTIKREILDEVKRDVLAPVERELKDVKNEIEDVAKQVFDDILHAIASEAFKKFVRWAEVFAPSQATLSLGPITFSFDLDGRLQLLKNTVKKPPSSKSGVRYLINTLAPNEIEVSASVNLALGLGSKELGVGGSLTVPTDRFLNKIDEVL